MIVTNTPVEHHPDFGLWVKREDLSCPPPGPPFSKTRGVYAHIAKRPEQVIGVLDTFHSQAGHAVASACSLLGKRCVNFFPFYKADQAGGLRAPQIASRDLGATLCALAAGRSAVLYHTARKTLPAQAAGSDWYMMPNALKLPEMVEETAAEVARTVLPPVKTILIAISSGTIAAGVIQGLEKAGWKGRIILHMGYARSEEQVLAYVEKMAQVPFHTIPWAGVDVELVNEGYEYKAVAKPGETPPWPCNAWYDLKAFRWWLREGRAKHGEALLWNIG